MQYKSLKYMLTIQEEGLLSAAAKRLKVSQSSISLYLLRMEESFGTALYDRRSHQMTKAGQLYCDGAKKILALHDTAMEDINTLADRLSISIGIDACISETMPWLINDMLKDFAAQYPDILVKIFFIDADKLCDMVLKGKADLAYCYLQRGLSEQLVHEEFMSENLMLVVPKEFDISAEGPWSALKQLKYIAMFKDSSVRPTCDTMLFLRKLSPVVHIESDSYELTQILMKTGLYTTIVPAGVVDKFEDFDIYPFYPATQVMSGFYILPEKSRMPHLLFLMQVIERLMRINYADNSNVIFLGGTLDGSSQS